MAASLHPDTQPGKAYVALQAAEDPLAIADVARLTGLDVRAAATALADLVASGHAIKLAGGAVVRYSRFIEYPPLPRPRWPEKLRARLVADVGVRVAYASFVDRAPSAATR